MLDLLKEPQFRKQQLRKLNKGKYGKEIAMQGIMTNESKWWAL
jgi:hypothetical protein